MELGLGLSQYVPPILYVGGIIIVLLTLFVRIEIGICYLVPFLPHANLLNWTNIYPFGKDYVDILLIAMIIRWVFDRFKTEDPFLIKTPFNIPLLLLVLWSFIEYIHGAIYLGLPISPSPDDPRFIAWKNFVVIPLIFFIVVNNIKDPNHIKLILLFMTISILVIDRNFYNIVKELDATHYSNDLKFGGVKSALNGNALAVFLAQYSVVLLALMWHMRNGWMKFLLALPIGLSYYCVMFLFSRSGYLATVVSLFVMGVLRDKRILIGLFLLFISYQELLPVAVKERIEMTKSEEGFDASTQQRLAMWDVAFTVVSGNPIFGAGLNFTQQFKIEVDEFSGQYWHSFHNAYLHTLVELGLIGFLVFIWLFFLAMKAGWRLYKMGDDGFQKGIGIGLICCIFACMAGNVAGTYWFYQNVMGFYWVLLALVVRSALNIEEQKDKKEINSANKLNETYKKYDRISNQRSDKHNKNVYKYINKPSITLRIFKLGIL